MRRQYLNIEFHCPHMDEGCEFTGTSDSVTKHIERQECKLTSYQCHQCDETIEGGQQALTAHIAAVYGKQRWTFTPCDIHAFVVIKRVVDKGLVHKDSTPPYYGLTGLKVYTQLSAEEDLPILEKTKKRATPKQIATYAKREIPNSEAGQFQKVEALFAWYKENEEQVAADNPLMPLPCFYLQKKHKVGEEPRGNRTLKNWRLFPKQVCGTAN
uniref:Uncharacterized protein n=1 Tax=Chromera velia CCMP2878 TaxID=1169474 RepID=A0A0G4HLJ5_9ALVE|eukprot:Cvel_7353.t1-p1 / transcript=Cvel_7353.t1 / gene=Cvel_7353 / organism=Chromera_velia_CCMP2878 / gene_product=hypothetical protein / transcript_product=hypothetical protein / location=Cvel_scaffold381:85839-90095(-) / protein_length=212 / sequence_SO=supercontig / SO=protein_coding / is_pseudo=false